MIGSGDGEQRAQRSLGLDAIEPGDRRCLRAVGGRRGGTGRTVAQGGGMDSRTVPFFLLHDLSLIHI